MILYYLQEIFRRFTMKKIVSLLICVCLVFSLCTVSFAEKATDGVLNAASVEEAASLLAKADKQYPLVICPGINHSPVYVCDNNGDYICDGSGTPLSGTIFITKTDKIVQCILKYVAIPLILTLITQRDCGLCCGVKKVTAEIFSYQKTYADGSHDYDLKLKDFHFPLSEFDENSFDGNYDKAWFYRMLPIQRYTEIAGEDNVYLYAFNLFGNVMDSADGLDEFIQFVKEETGSDKVNLLNVSLGGSVFTAYMDRYVDKGDINEIVNVVAVFYGSSVFGDFFAREWNLGDKSVYSDSFPYMMKLEAGNEALGYLINIAIRILPKEELGAIISSFYDVMLENLMVNTSQFWATLPVSRYEELADRYLSDSEHKELRKSTDEFYHAQLNLVDNIKKFKAQGGEISFICGYGLKFGDEQYSFLSLVNSFDKVNSDGIIEISSASLGATYAPAGKTLSKEYLDSVKNPAYISPDKSVDISTCAFPENVWLFENQHHEIGGNDVALRLASEILCFDEIKDVNSAPDKYPQFNGTRNTKWVNRSYMPKVAKLDRSLYTDEQLAALDAAVAETQAMMNRTVIDSQNDNEIVRKFKNTLADMGLEAYDNGPTTSQIIGVYLAKAVSDLVYLIVGPNGFSDM